MKVTIEKWSTIQAVTTDIDGNKQAVVLETLCEDLPFRKKEVLKMDISSVTGISNEFLKGVQFPINELELDLELSQYEDLVHHFKFSKE